MWRHSRAEFRDVAITSCDWRHGLGSTLLSRLFSSNPSTIQRLGSAFPRRPDYIRFTRRRVKPGGIGTNFTRPLRPFLDGTCIAMVSRFIFYRCRCASTRSLLYSLLRAFRYAFDYSRRRFVSLSRGWRPVRTHHKHTQIRECDRFYS